MASTMHCGTRDQAAHAGHDAHRALAQAGHGGRDDHAGHDPEKFRRRFWWSLLLTLPIVVTSEMVMEWFGYELDIPGIELVGPVLGSIVFFWGGQPFLAGGRAEIRDRQPGMMLLVSMAIVVAYVASLASSLGWFDLEFWWELSALVTIMLLGHWQEMKAIGQARGALAALAELLPDDAERVAADGSVEHVRLEDLRVGDVVLVRPGGRVPADGVIVDGEAELDESMVTGESKPVAKRRGDRVVGGTRVDRLVRPCRDHRGGRGDRARRHPAARRRGAAEPQPRAGARRPVRRASLLRRRLRRRRNGSWRGRCSPATSTSRSCAPSPCS
ncbi:MAG: hypothetical protein KatS3mg009_1250 [Acidimicrobiia bacterium]|nr:MAG: hypothetical protein KatS3mg009_1250 [Acidimicrobiia bacterium]